LQEEVVIVGAGTWLELWDSSRWGEMMVEIDAADMDFASGVQEAGE
jgi:DNA-binding transcriptional regulator/RsmH inhibitor MraZ